LVNSKCKIKISKQIRIQKWQIRKIDFIFKNKPGSFFACRVALNTQHRIKKNIHPRMTVEGGMQIRVNSFLIVIISGVIISSCRTENLEHILSEQCDTTSVSFEWDIFPIMEMHCNDAVCHGGDLPQRQIDLTHYEGVSRVAENSLLISAITHEEGYEPMPLGSEALSDCKIKKIKAWINQGYPDN
jgi:hypothetical protein